MSSQAIQAIGYAAAEATTITIPGTYQTGDVMIIYSYVNSITVPLIPTGWTNIVNNSGNSAAWRIGYKLAASASETSGTWTNSTGLICHVYRNVTTVKTFWQQANTGNGAGSTNIPYPAISPKCPGTSWLMAVGGCSSNLATVGPPTSMAQQVVDPTPTLINLIGSDTNGVYTSGTYAGNSVAMGVSTQARSVILELMAEALGPINNFQFVSAGDGMSVSEKIR